MKVKLLLFRRDKCDKKKFCYRLIVIWIRRYFWTAGLWYHLHLFQIDILAQGCRPRTRWGQCWTNWWAPRETVSHEIPQAMWFSWSSTWSPMYFPKESLSMQISARQFTLLLCNWLYFHFSFILDPTTCQTWNFIFLGQMIFCEKSESLRWYVRFLIHNRLYSQDFKRLKPF